MCVHYTSKCEIRDATVRSTDIPTLFGMCNPPLPKCYFSECSACLGIEKLRDDVLTSLEENEVDQIIYKQWVSTDDPRLKLFVQQQKFVDTFCVFL